MSQDDPPPLSFSPDVSVPLYCVCRKPDDGSPMIQCDTCSEWFHANCVNLTFSEIRRLGKLKKKKWICQSCLTKPSPPQSTPSCSSQKKFTYKTKCPNCPLTFKTTKGLQNHIESKHNDLPQNTGVTPPTTPHQIDDITFPRDTVEVTNDLPVRCPHCPNRFKDEACLSQHTRHHHGSVFRGKIIARNIDSDVQLQKGQKSNDINQKLQNITTSLKKIYISDDLDKTEFMNIYNNLIDVLKEAHQTLPGPKHPATKFYQLRKKKALFKTNERGFQQSSNPQRSSKRARQRRSDKFNYDLIQYEYYNKRKSCVRRIMNNGEHVSCSIPIKTLHEAFSSRWSIENNEVRINYGLPLTRSEQDTINNGFSLLITSDETEFHIKRMDSQSSPGHDGITVRVLKSTNCNECLAWLFSNFNKWCFLPDSLREARTSLIYKKGDKSNPSNWRPISVCSTIRRLYERIILAKMRQYTTVSDFQTGSQHLPGTFLNSSIINGCLSKAKTEKMDITVIFLDIAKAFDSIGHAHITNTIRHLPYPDPLRSIIFNLTFGNSTRIFNNCQLSSPIIFKSGIFQGSVISPEIFNLCIDFILRTLSEVEVANNYGFSVNHYLKPISTLGFVDDTALVGQNKMAACELMSMAVSLFDEIGLDVNVDKTQAIVLEDGKLCTDGICYSEDIVLQPVQENERIKYLGVNFNDEIVFDADSILKKIGKSIETLISTPFLLPHQKLSIINQFIWPTAIYPLQSAPLIKIPSKFLDDLDKVLRSSIREILCLPQDSPNAMLYSSSSVKGLNLINASWESCIQSHGICFTLMRGKNEYVKTLRNLEVEMEIATLRLDIPQDCYEEIINSSKSSSSVNRKLRKIMRDKQYTEWCKLSTHGKGVETFLQSTSINTSLFNKKGLSSSEYTNYFKMVSNTVPVKTLHGRGQGRPHCRRCSETKETLAHVLGSCPYGSLLRNDRHHRIRKMIADSLRSKDLEVYEELPTLDRRIDIIAINRVENFAVILDPTVRTETSLTQDEDVDKEKKSIYEPCIEDLRRKCNLNETCRITVHGLLIGSRGMIPKSVQQLLKTLKIPKSIIEDIAISAVKGSCRIIHNHFYLPLT